LNVWSNIIQIGKLGGGSYAYGSTRVPAVWFQPDTTKIVVTAGYNGDNKTHQAAKYQLPMYTKSTIEIVVRGKYCWLSINGVYDSVVAIGDRSLLSDVKVYFGEPTSPAANAVLTHVYYGPV